MADEGRLIDRRRAAAARSVRVVCLILAGASFTIAGILFFRHLSSKDRLRLRRCNCRLLPARVVSRGQGLEERGGMQFPVYHVRYELTFQGRRIEGRGRVSREWYNWLDRGSEVHVYVDVSEPRRHFLELEYALRVGRILRAACIAAAIGLALVVCAIFPRLFRRQPPTML